MAIGLDIPPWVLYNLSIVSFGKGHWLGKIIASNPFSEAYQSFDR